MDKTSLESAFSLVDSSGNVVSGTFDLTGDPLVFKPDQELMHGQIYTAKVLGAAMALNTATLDTNMDGMGTGSPVDDFLWSFTTKRAPLPVVSDISPDNGQRHVLISDFGG